MPYQARPKNQNLAFAHAQYPTHAFTQSCPCQGGGCAGTLLGGDEADHSVANGRHVVNDAVDDSGLVLKVGLLPLTSIVIRVCRVRWVRWVRSANGLCRWQVGDLPEVDAARDVTDLCKSHLLLQTAHKPH